ncbi:MAG TPA: VOC family protein [Microlunatus sp.]|nr:VOC family protein [Microlunatus sp.]
MANLVVHFEIHASEPQRLIDFYSALLGWRFSQFGDMPYWSIDTGEGSIGLDHPGNGINGGLTERRGPAPSPGAPVNGANVVVGVEGSVDELFHRGLELGGSEAVAPNDMPGVGRLAYLLDPDGNVFGMISPVMSDGTSTIG